MKKYTAIYNKKVNPEIVYQELDRINKKYKGLKPQIVVDEAEPENAPLHPAFEWDNATAGNEWRKQQARNLIHGVRVSVNEKPPERVFVSIKDDDTRESTYYPISQVVLVPEMRAKMMAACMVELVAIKAKYKELSDAIEFSQVFNAITALEQSEVA